MAQRFSVATIDICVDSIAPPHIRVGALMATSAETGGNGCVRAMARSLPLIAVVGASHAQRPREDLMDLQMLVQRVRGDFDEMPGLCLTLAQAARLWQIEPPLCRRVIDTLVDRRFLRWTPAGMVTRADA